MRIYDPRLGRFLSVDPLTKSFTLFTLYEFAGIKPIPSVDMDEMEERGIHDEKFNSLFYVAYYLLRNS